MPRSRKEQELERARRGLGELLSRGAGTGGVDGAERLGAAIVAMSQVPDAGPELARAALEALEEARDAQGLGVLAAVAVLARPDLAGEAAAARDRLHLAGVRSPVEEVVGTMEVKEA
jgi:hypothetical protein